MLKFVDIQKRNPEKESVKARSKNFTEIYSRFVKKKAEEQSARCSQCGIPFCQVHCPLQNNIPGIDADCGGSMACATCHVYVKEEWFNKLPKKEDGEEDMLDMAYEPRKISRLSCQLIVSDELEGLVINLPAKQA